VSGIDPKGFATAPSAAGMKLRDLPAATLLDEFHALTRLAYLLSGDQSRSEDAAAEAIARVWQRSATVEIEELRAYLRRTLINIVTRSRRRFRSEQQVSRYGDQAAEDILLETAAAQRIDVGQALLLLPTDQRAVIVLRYYEDLSEEAIAAILRVPPGTVKSRSSRGLAAMRTLPEGADSD
jgi:RNA polymerase sigma factor (sigma-70 family)